MEYTSIPHRVFEQARRRPSRPAYFIKEAGAWKPTSWADYAAQIRQAGKAMIALGIKRGDTVCILGFNRPEWVIFDVGCMTVGGIPAGIYTTNSPEECQYIINHAQASLLLVEDMGQYNKVSKVRDKLPSLKRIITMQGAAAIDDPLVLSWDAFMTKGNGIDDAEFDDRIATLEAHQVAKLIYTSGTTGPPKGVMLSHRNIAWIGRAAAELVDWHADDLIVSYLPLSHIAEQNLTIHVPATTGCAVYYAESMQKLPENLREVQPTLFLGVPRIWEKLHAAVSARLAEANTIRTKLVSWAMGVGTRTSKLRMQGKQPKGLLGLEYNLANKLIFSKLKSAVGLARARACVTGAAPIAREVLDFFASLDIVIQEIYGLSETCGAISFNYAGRIRFGSVGRAINRVEVKIADDGEILTRGPNVFMGYYKDHEATSETLVDGWFYSGDVGNRDADGHLYIVDRKKHIIITAGGKNITPANIENEIKTKDSIISHVHAHGDRRPYVTALVTIHPIDAIEWGRERGLLDGHEAAEKMTLALKENPNARPEGLGELMARVTNQAALKERVARAVRQANERLSRVEQVKRVYLLDRDLSIEEDEVTPTMKVKRKKVEKKFAHIFDRLYEDASFGIVVIEK